MSVAVKTGKKNITFEEYLDLEEKAESKNEYLNGEIVAMSGGTPNHSMISMNVGTAINNALRKNNKRCQVFDSNLKVYFEKVNVGAYPDVLVICQELEYHKDRKDVITNPLLIIEVLSNSTEDYDRGKKFQHYRSLPSFKEYVLIAQYEPKVESWYKMEENVWRISNAIKLEASIPLYSIECEISLEDIYYLIENFEEEET